MIREMEKERILGQEEVIIKDLLLKIYDMDLAKCIGMMILFIRDSGMKDFKVEKVKFGKKEN